MHNFNQLGGQGFWNNAVAVHPFQENVLFVGGQVSILRITVDETSDANSDEALGATADVIADVWSGPSQNVHVDHHNLTIIPIDRDANHFYILNANDGGIAFSMDSGNSFTQTGDTNNREGNHPSFSGYNVTQFYGVDKMNGVDRYVGGTQDNSNWISPANPDSSSYWLLGPDGDGFESIWHYSDPNKLVTTTQYSQIHRSDDGGVSWNLVSPAGPGCFFGEPTCSFFTLIAGSKIEPDLVYTVSKSGVLRSLDFAENWEVVRLPEQWQFSPFANIIRSSIASQRIVWTGSGLSDENRLFVSDDGGSSYVEANGYDGAELGQLSGLNTHPISKSTAYALFSAADAPKILKTVDLGKSWEDISGFVNNASESNNGFPDVATYSLLVIPFDTNRIWAGTEIGLFESLNGGLTWQYSDNGLPPVAIWEMKVVNDEIVLATHGRGVWTVSFPELEGYEPPEAIALLPILEVDENALGGVVSTSYTLRSDFDSAFIRVAAQDIDQFTSIRFPIESYLSRDSSIITIEGLSRDTIVEARISLECYKAGEIFRDVEFVQVYGVDSMPRFAYENDFDQDLGDFARLDFNVYQEVGFESRALHTLHPYEGFDQKYLAILTVPIIVSSSDPTMAFDEIAMIEPGHPGTVFGDRDFFDYVAIEGTKDRGETWRVIEAYDARWSQSWQSNFEIDPKEVDPQLVETHEVDLTSTFDPGDTVFLRFRLQSDLFTEGWGWMIDNLSIQEDPTSITTIDESTSMQITAFPNPAGDQINFQYNLKRSEDVEIAIWSITGSILTTLDSGLRMPGDHQIAFDASKVPPGIYLFCLKTRKELWNLKWIKP
jgi:hypothetical protein